MSSKQLSKEVGKQNWGDYKESAPCKGYGIYEDVQAWNSIMNN